MDIEVDLRSLALVGTSSFQITLLHSPPILDTRGRKIIRLLQPSLVQQDGNVRFRHFLTVDFHDDMVRNSGGIDTLVRVLDPSEEGAVLEPVVYASMLAGDPDPLWMIVA